MTEKEKFLREFLDISDKQTRDTIISVCEANNNQFLVALTGKLYDKIQEKVDKVDFSYVSGSRGDITKIPHYDSLMECLDIIRKIVIEYRQSTEPVDTVTTAVENLKLRKNMFTKAFSINAQLPILTYNSISLAIVESVSFLIATSIEYIKDPEAETFQMALDVISYRKSMDNLLFNNLDSFNKSCQNKEFDKAMEAIMSRTVAREAVEMLAITKDNPELHFEPVKMDLIDAIMNDDEPDCCDDCNDSDNNDTPFLTDEEMKRDAEDPDGIISTPEESPEKLQEKAGFWSAGLSYIKDQIVMSISRTIFPIIRRLVSTFEYARQNASDYYNLQAEMLQINAMGLQNNSSLSDAQKKQVYNNQMKKVADFKRKANALAIDMKASTVAADRQASLDARKFKADDIYQVDDDYSSSALF